MAFEVHQKRSGQKILSPRSDTSWSVSLRALSCTNGANIHGNVNITGLEFKSLSVIDSEGASSELLRE